MMSYHSQHGNSIVPTIAEKNAVTNTQGFDTIQVTTEEEKNDDTIATRHATNVQLENRSTIKIIC